MYLKEFVLGLRVSLRYSSYNTLFEQLTARRFRSLIVGPNPVYSHSEGTIPRILPGADQEHLGHGPGERSPGRGALSGDWDQGDEGTQVPRGGTSETQTQKGVG